jgi:hypothetical protein
LISEAPYLPPYCAFGIVLGKVHDGVCFEVAYEAVHVERFYICPFSISQTASRTLQF